MMNSRTKLVAGIVAIATIVLLAPGPSSGANSASGDWRDAALWTHMTGGEKIRHFEVTPLGSVFVSTDARVAALDPDTGDVIWEREDIRRCGTDDYDGTVRCNFLGKGETRFSAIANTNIGLFQVGSLGRANPCDRAAVLNLETGSTIWDSVDIPLRNVKDFLYVPELDQFLLAGGADGKRGVLAAVSGSDGGLLWQRDIYFLDRFKFIGVPDDARVLAYGRTNDAQRALVSLSLADGSEQWRLEGFLRNDARNRNALVLRDTAETAILYVTKDGPFRVRLDSGDVLWRVGLWDKDPSDFAPMVLDGELLFVPNGKMIDALHVDDGSRVWQTVKQFNAERIDIRRLSRGLLVRAKSLDLLDPQTGRSLWAKRVRIGAGSRLLKKHREMSAKLPVHVEVEKESAFIAGQGRFETVDLATGDVKHLAEYDLHSEWPTRIEETDGSFVLMSRQNLLRVSRSGEIAYHVYLKAPGASGWTKALAVAAFVGSAAVAGSQAGGLTFSAYVDPSGVLGARYGATLEAPENYFMYTEMPFDGRKGFSLVRINKASGKETGRLWLDQRSPEYTIDHVTETVYFRSADHELSALRFVE